MEVLAEKIKNRTAEYFSIAFPAVLGQQSGVNSDPGLRSAAHAQAHHSHGSFADRTGSDFRFRHRRQRRSARAEAPEGCWNFATEPALPQGNGSWFRKVPG